MNPPKIHLYVGTRLLHSGELSKPTEFGRESDVDAGRVYALLPINGAYRMAIANKEYVDMSRRLVLVTPLDDGHVRVENLSRTNFIHIATQEPLWPAQQRDLEVPTVLTVFDRRIEIARAKQYETMLVSMKEPVAPPGSVREPLAVDVGSNFPLREKLSHADREQLTKWLGAVTRVLQSAIGSADFYERAASEMVELIGLDTGRVLEIGADGTWNVIASFDRETGKELSSRWVPVSDLLRQVITDKRTCWSTGTSPTGGDSPEGPTLTAAIAAPLLDQSGEVIGALYGDRRRTGSSAGEIIGELEAMLVETLARGVAAGRARVEQERNAAAVQIRFEQFFTPELSRQLAANPDLLTRRDSEVTVLFCDLRRFSTISEELGAEVTMEWLSDVMGVMAECATVYDGAIIDYIGDELMVMWGAPAAQPDHAMRACHAALKMARQCSELDKKWRGRLGHPTQFGYGINTGQARVGNVGFERKFRYAPFGNTVNLASRVQGATKYLGASVVVTDATYQQLRSRPISRRLCSVRVVNIEQPVMLYELRPDDTSETKELCQKYEEALTLFEQEDLPQSTSILSEILRTHPNDGPTLLLLSRAVNCLLHQEQPFNPVFDLPGK